MSQTLKTIEAFTPEAKQKFQDHAKYIADVWDAVNGIEIPAEVEHQIRIGVPQMVDALADFAYILALIFLKIAKDSEEGEK